MGFLDFITFYMVYQKLSRPPEKSQTTHRGSSPQVENHWSNNIVDPIYL